MSKLVAERGGFELMPELGYQPVNKYLPPRPRRAGDRYRGEDAATGNESPLRWLDRLVRRERVVRCRIAGSVCAVGPVATDSRGPRPDPQR